MMKIGFIGTGLMGLPMAKNLLKSDFKLKVFNRSINKAEPLKEFGAEISKTLGEVVKDNDFIITMLTDDSAVDAIMNNSDLSEMGNPTLVGPIGSGQVSKLANQIVVGVTIGAVAEAITLCEKAGADPVKLIKALSGGWADSKILQTHGKRMIDKDFTPKGKTFTHLKDMNNILECANSYNTHLPISNLVKEMYKTLVDNGHGNTDHSSLYNEIERINKK